MAMKPMIASRLVGRRKTAPPAACLSASIVWLKTAAETTMTIARTTNCSKTDSPAARAMAVEKAPRNDPMLQVPWRRDMIGVVPARSMASPLAFMQTSMEPCAAP